MKDGKNETISAFMQKVLDNNLLNSIKSVLKYGDASIAGYKPDTADFSDDRLPYHLFIKIADKASEAIFILMYRLYNKRDTFKYNSDIHRKVIGIVLLFMWYGIDIHRIWDAVRVLPQEKMWSNVIVDFAFSEEMQILRDIAFLEKIKDPKTINQEALGNF